MNYEGAGNAMVGGGLGAVPEERGPLAVLEIEIVEMIVAGYSNQEIAGRLSTTESAITHQVHGIFNRLGVSGRLELALFAVDRGLIPTR